MEYLTRQRKASCSDDESSTDDMEMETALENEYPKIACTICLENNKREPRIRCAVCKDVILCLQCFSFGLETQTHRCDHPYHIDRLHIPRDDTDWTLTEDRDLLQALIECGFGNELDLGRRFPHRTVSEISERISFLLDMKDFPLRCAIQVDPQPLLPINNDAPSENPPRFPRKGINAKQLGGYNAARGDFSCEHNNTAEQSMMKLSLSSDEEESDEELTQEMNIAIAEGYNEVIRDREERKLIIKEHALLLPKTVMRVLTTRPKLIFAMSLLNRLDFDSLIEGLVMEETLGLEIRKLQKYRNLGISRLQGMSFYEKLNAMRTCSYREIRSLQNKSKAVPQVIFPNPAQARVPNPLNVAAFIGYEKLTNDEKNLCSKERITPEAFLNGKKLLMEINKDAGGVRLKHARQLLHIDVNKTRKIFNFLRDNKLINAI